MNVVLFSTPAAISSDDSSLSGSSLTPAADGTQANSFETVLGASSSATPKSPTLPAQKCESKGSRSNSLPANRNSALAQSNRPAKSVSRNEVPAEVENATPDLSSNLGSGDGASTTSEKSDNQKSESSSVKVAGQILPEALLNTLLTPLQQYVLGEVPKIESKAIAVESNAAPVIEGIQSVASKTDSISNLSQVDLSQVANVSKADLTPAQPGFSDAPSIAGSTIENIKTDTDSAAPAINSFPEGRSRLTSDSPQLQVREFSDRARTPREVGAESADVAKSSVSVDQTDFSEADLSRSAKELENAVEWPIGAPAQFPKPLGEMSREVSGPEPRTLPDNHEIVRSADVSIPSGPSVPEKILETAAEAAGEGVKETGPSINPAVVPSLNRPNVVIPNFARSASLRPSATPAQTVDAPAITSVTQLGLTAKPAPSVVRNSPGVAVPLQSGAVAVPGSATVVKPPVASKGDKRNQQIITLPQTPGINPRIGQPIQNLAELAGDTIPTKGVAEAHSSATPAVTKEKVIPIAGASDVGSRIAAQQTIGPRTIAPSRTIDSTRIQQVSPPRIGRPNAILPSGGEGTNAAGLRPSVSMPAQVSSGIVSTKSDAGFRTATEDRQTVSLSRTPFQAPTPINNMAAAQSVRISPPASHEQTTIQRNAPARESGVPEIQSRIEPPAQTISKSSAASEQNAQNQNSDNSDPAQHETAIVAVTPSEHLGNLGAPTTPSSKRAEPSPIRETNNVQGAAVVRSDRSASPNSGEDLDTSKRDEGEMDRSDSPADPAILNPEYFPEVTRGGGRDLDSTETSSASLASRARSVDTSAVTGRRDATSGTGDAQHDPAMALRTNSETENQTFGKNLPSVGKNDSSLRAAEQIALKPDSRASASEFNGRPVDPSLLLNLSSHPEVDRTSHSANADSKDFAIGHAQLAGDVWSAVEKFRATGREDWVVSLRPDQDTQLNLKLKMKDDQLLIQATLERGNWDAVAPQWTELQASFAERGIQLRPLESVSNQTWVAQQQFGQSGSGGHEHRQTAADLAYVRDFFELNQSLGRGRQESKKPAVAAPPARSNQVLETWA